MASINDSVHDPRPFHGIWYSKYLSFLNGYCTKTPVSLEDIDNYVAIDVESHFPRVRIGTLYGTLWHVQPFRNDPHNDPWHWSDSLFELSEPGVLTSSEFLKHQVLNSIVELFYPTLKYIPAKKANQKPGILVTCDRGLELNSNPDHGHNSGSNPAINRLPSRHPAYILMTGGPQWLERVSPQISSTWTPTFLFRNTSLSNLFGNNRQQLSELFVYIFHRLFNFIDTNSLENRDVCRTYQNAKRILEQYLSGRTLKTNIKRIWTSKRNSHVTEVFLESFPYTPVGSTVWFQNLPWSDLNGRLLTNAVSLLHFADTPKPSAKHVCVPLRWPKVVLDLDTSGREDLEDVNGHAQLLVKHQVRSGMTYAEFIAALLAIQYEVFGMSQHTAYGVWIYKDFPFIPETWTELKNATDTRQTIFGIHRWRSNRVTPSQFYHNPIVQCDSGKFGTGLQALFHPDTIPYCHFNDPLIPLQDLGTGKHLDYNIVQSNYLNRRIYHLYWRITGPCLYPFQSQLVHMGYRNNGSYFEGKASDRDLGPTWDVLGVSAPEHEDQDSSSALEFRKMKDRLYVGHIQHGHERVGYLRIASFDFADPLLLMFDLRMGQPDMHLEQSRRLGSENFCSLFAELMRKLLEPGDIRNVIIDIRSNTGGLAHAPLIASFFGDNRFGPDGQFAVPNPRNSSEVGTGAKRSKLWTDILKEYQNQSYGNILEQADEMTNIIDVRENIRRYGNDCVFQNGTVYILTDECACSEGDEFPHYFLGDRLNRDIGNGVQTYFVGEISGRIIGGTFCNLTKEGLPKVRGPQPIPISRIENSSAGLVKINGRPLSVQDDHTAMDILIPNIIELVWDDIGLLENQENRTYEDRSTWRDSWIDAILNHIGG